MDVMSYEEMSVSYQLYQSQTVPCILKNEVNISIHAVETAKTAHFINSDRNIK